MKTIHYEKTLFEYDGPQIFEARDCIGGRYIAVALKPNNQKSRYLVVGTAPKSLQSFRSGSLDLRSLLLEIGRDEWYLIESENINEDLFMKLQTASLTDSQFLPDPDFYLHDQPISNSIVSEARSRNNLVLALIADPPEAAESHRIRANTLAGLLRHFQSLISRSCQKVRKDAGTPAKRTEPRADVMDVVIPAAAGSFQILLESSTQSDSFETNTELASGLQLIDNLFTNVVDMEDKQLAVENYRGHLAGTFLKLLQFLTKYETSLRYSWADPSHDEPNCGRVSLHQAKILADSLAQVENLSSEDVTTTATVYMLKSANTQVENLSSEDVTLVGNFERVNRAKGTWGLLTAEGIINGKVSEDGPDLDGLTVGKCYKFFCIEEIEASSAGSEEIRKFNLKRIEPHDE